MALLIVVSFESTAMNAGQVTDEGLKAVSIFYSDTLKLDTLIDLGLEISEVRDRDILAFVSNDDINRLKDIGLLYKVMDGDFEEILNYDNNLEEFLQFHGYDSMTAELQYINSTYSNIATLYELGQSVQGRIIWGLKITDNPDNEENEPEVRICGAHHGDEYMSVELPLLLAWHLVENYGIDPSLTNLVDNREIWIIPMVNPDGREAGTRRNANNVDLNRDYGYMWIGSGGSPSPFSQPETQSIRDHALDNNFVLSLSFHTSGDIVNYIWNYKGEPVADNDVVVMLSEQYGSHNGYWVVEGYDWYQTRGDTNDFSYGCRGDIDWTIETQNYDIPEAWDLNCEAMIEIIDAADMGITGIVTDANTGEPINATIWVEEVFWPCFTDPKIGDYHRVLMPGTYTVHFTANGYEEQVHVIEVVDLDVPTILNVELSPADEYYAYQVTSCNFYDPYSYPNNFQNNPTEAISSLGAPDGECASLGRGGVIVLDMGVKILNKENSTDLTVFEGDGTLDGYDVRASQEWDGPWIEIGSGFGTTEFDLQDGSLEWAQYLEIRDDYDGSPYEKNPGVDIDAIQNLAPDKHFYLNLEDFPFYEAEEPHNEMCGPAVAQMALNYMWWNSSQDPEPPMTFDDQSWLYDRGIENNSDPGLPYFDLQGMWHTIQYNKPMPYSEYGYNFLKRHNADQDEMLKQICQWINYTVGTIGGYKEGHPLHVPSIIPAYGDYSNWMAIRGIRTNGWAYPLPDELTIYGFWVNDPLPGGLGENSYKEISEFTDDYYQAMITGDYIGEYLAVLEPPESTEHCELNIAESQPWFTPMQRNLLIYVRTHDKVSEQLKTMTDQWIIQAAIDGVTEELIPYDEGFAAVFENTVPGKPMFIENAVGNDYYAVPFDLRGTVVVVLIDADDGSFKETSWVEDPVKYLPISREEAQQIAFEFAVKLGLKIRDPNDIQPELVHRKSTLYYPEWQVLIGEYGIYIDQDGTVTYIIFK